MISKTVKYVINNEEIIIDTDVFNTLETFNNKCKLCGSKDVKVTNYNETLHGVGIRCKKCEKLIWLGKKENNNKRKG